MDKQTDLGKYEARLIAVRIRHLFAIKRYDKGSWITGLYPYTNSVNRIKEYIHNYFKAFDCYEKDEDFVYKELKKLCQRGNYDD